MDEDLHRSVMPVYLKETPIPSGSNAAIKALINQFDLTSSTLAKIVGIQFEDIEMEIENAEFPRNWKEALVDQLVQLADYGMNAINERLKWLNGTDFKTERDQLIVFYDEVHQKMTKKIGNVRLRRGVF